MLEIFLTTPDEVEEYAKMMQSNSSDNCVHHCNFEFLNFFDPELQLHDKKKKFEGLLSELKKFKVQTILVLEYEKRIDRKIFRSSTKLIASDSDVDEAFTSMYQSKMTKIKNSASEDWIAIESIVKCSINIFERQYKQK